jgi:hypothetical protein
MLRILLMLILVHLVSACMSFERLHDPDGMTRKERIRMQDNERSERQVREEIEWNARLLDLELGMSRQEASLILGKPKRVEFTESQYIQTYRFHNQYMWLFFNKEDSLLRWSEDSGEIKPRTTNSIVDSGSSKNASR